MPTAKKLKYFSKGQDRKVAVHFSVLNICLSIIVFTLFPNSTAFSILGLESKNIHHKQEYSSELYKIKQ